jgi:hypothetical protein
MYRSSSLSLPLRFSNHIFVPVSPNAYYIPCKSHHPWFNDPNIWWRVQIMKLLIVLVSSDSCHFIPHRSKYLLSTLFSKLPQLMWETKFHTHA